VLSLGFDGEERLMTEPVAPPGGLGWLTDGLLEPPKPPPPGSDPTLIGGFLFPHFAPSPVGTGAYTVDLDRAPAAIRELEEALEKLEVLRADALHLGRVVPPASDAVSQDAAAVLGAAASGGPGSLVEALAEGTTQLKSLIAKTREELVAYGRAEGEGRAAFLPNEKA